MRRRTGRERGDPMDEQSVIHNTFVIERSFPQPVERVFAAFADSAKKRRWFAEGEKHDVEEFEMDFRVGGTERHRYRFKDGTPFPGVELKNHWIYQEIVPNRLVVSANAMDLGGKRISASLVTIELLPTDNGTNKGTDLICTHQGAFFENSGGPEMREAGWRSLFDKLAAELAK
jgi:uncharacterized protein YndB with AHSA1/START domain